MKTLLITIAIILLASIISIGPATAGEVVDVSAGVDIASRYVWRGADIASTPSFQPSLAVGYGGFELGAWGAYTMSNQQSESDEIDFWLSYTVVTNSGMSITGLVTDYYYPNAGIKFGNFNDYDDVTGEGDPDPGAHLLEAGLSISGCEKFPLTFSAFYNFHNEAGNNTYFEVSYPVATASGELNFFVGATGGSKDNPDYYGADAFAVINMGVTASREIEFSESFSAPVSVSFILNPRQEISYLVFMLSL